MPKPTLLTTRPSTREPSISFSTAAGGTNVATALRRVTAHPAEARAAIGISYNPN